MKKIFISSLMIMFVLIQGCGTGVKDEDIIKVLENYKIDVVGTYMNTLSRSSSDYRSESVYELEFSAVPINIKIIEKNNDVSEVKVTANLENQYFRLEKEQVITYRLENQNGTLKVINANMETGDMTVKPTLEYNLDMFYENVYEKNVNLRYFEDSDKPLILDNGTEIKNPLGGEWVDIELNRENVKSIDWVNGETLMEDYLISKNDFSYSGVVIFTLKDGKKYEGNISIDYYPREDKNWEEEPRYRGTGGINIKIWSIEE